MYQYPYQYSMQCYPESHQYLNEHSIERNHCPNSYPVQCNPNPCVPNHNYPCTADCEHLCSRHRLVSKCLYSKSFFCSLLKRNTSSFNMYVGYALS